MNKVNILVTAVGSELAFSIVKALKKINDLEVTLIGCDIYPEVVGKYWCEHFYQVPPVKNKEAYLSAFKNIIEKHQVNFIIPSSDYEFPILSEIKDDVVRDHNCHILVNSPEMIGIFCDKWLAHQYMVQQHISVPKTICMTHEPDLQSAIERNNLSFPFIIKPRVGGGSRSIYHVENTTMLNAIQTIVPNGLIQEYLYPDNEEYSSGTFRTTHNQVFVVIFKRTLKFGMTNTASIIKNHELEEFCRETILKTSLTGSNNIQFRVTENGPKILEINPRFSGTTGIRANFGFNDVEMWIKDSLNIAITAPEIKSGFVLRYMEEQYHLND